MEEHYRFDHLICRSGFGVVYNEYRKDDNEEVIIKSEDKRIKGGNYLKEIYFLSKLKRHENI